MAGNEPYGLTPTKKTYTIAEAIEFIKRENRQPTTTPIRWVNANTGKPVSIACAGNSL